jgi:hypothetical protein
VSLFGNELRHRLSTLTIRTCSTLLCRCIYRAVELAEGWTGYLIRMSFLPFAILPQTTPFSFPLDPRRTRTLFRHPRRYRNGLRTSRFLLLLAVVLSPERSFASQNSRRQAQQRRIGSSVPYFDGKDDCVNTGYSGRGCIGGCRSIR